MVDVKTERESAEARLKALEEAHGHLMNTLRENESQRLQYAGAIAAYLRVEEMLSASVTETNEDG